LSYHLLSRRPAEQDVYTLALERTATIMERFDNIRVAFSGGKDSTAVLNIALEVAHSDPRFERHLPLRACFFDEEAIPLETEEYVRRMGQRDDIALEWYCLPVKHRNACSREFPYWWPWAPEARDKWCRPLPPEAITVLAGFPAEPAAARLTIPQSDGLMFTAGQGNCATLMGIRAQESRTRTWALLRHASENYMIKYTEGESAGNIWKAYPVYDWTTEDVWTAPAIKGWDYNRAYDRFEMAGIPHSSQRCSPAFGEEPLQKLHTFASCFPDVWGKMAERVPGAGSAVRYALTELYGYHKRPQKPEGMLWPDFLTRYIQKFGPADRPIVIKRVRDALGRHYRKTSDPMVIRTPHPESGVSWDYLLSIAMRGDFKDRRSATAAARVPVIGKGIPAPHIWHKYAAELTQIIADGTYVELAAPTPPPPDPYALIPPYAKELP